MKTTMSLLRHRRYHSYAVEFGNTPVISTVFGRPGLENRYVQVNFRSGPRIQPNSLQGVDHATDQIGRPQRRFVEAF